MFLPRRCDFEVVEGRGIPTKEQSAVSSRGEASRTLGSGEGSSPTSYAKLHPGPGQPREQAASHQRARIHAAMIELVAERGYGAVTVRDRDTTEQVRIPIDRVAEEIAGRLRR